MRDTYGDSLSCSGQNFNKTFTERQLFDMFGSFVPFEEYYSAGFLDKIVEIYGCGFNYI